MPTPTRSTHTPGPWEVNENDPSGDALDVEAVNGGPRICTVDVAGALDCSPPYSEAEVRANARLIAAAPDLLALVRRMVDLMPCDTETHHPDNKGCDFCTARALLARLEA